MTPARLLVGTLVAIACGSLTPAFAGKPLKVFILTGQSNMEGHAQTFTFPAIAKDPNTADMYKDMVGPDGKPVICDNVWISYSYGDFFGKPIGVKTGKLTAGWGSQHHIGTGKIGPEFTFGIYMQKHLNEPILLIKNAWGGKSLKGDFRPPSAPLPDSASDKEKESAGAYYKMMMDHIKDVLTDPKKVCPVYDPKDGYELAGFVWFQGYNDLVGSYPAIEPSKGKKSVKDYSEYTRLLACLIRDVRKDLKAPQLPFVIGVMGVDGEKDTGPNMLAFRKAMAAPAEMDEFKGNVVNVLTAKYWPQDLDDLSAKTAPFNAEQKRLEKELAGQNLSQSEHKKKLDEIRAEISAKKKAALTADELFLLEHGISNAGFHYYGSAKFFGQIGKAFADALAGIRKGNDVTR